MPIERLPPTKRIDNEINALRYNLGEDVAPKDVFGKLVKLAMRRIVQEVLKTKSASSLAATITNTPKKLRAIATALNIQR